MPPAPRGETISYSPSIAPLGRGIAQIIAASRPPAYVYASMTVTNEARSVEAPSPELAVSRYPPHATRGFLHRGPRRARVWLGGVVTPGPPTSEGLARWGGYTGAPDERGFGSVGWLHGRLARHHVDARRRREHKSRIRRRSIGQLPAEVELVHHPIRLVDLHRFDGSIRRSRDLHPRYSLLQPLRHARQHTSSASIAGGVQARQLLFQLRMPQQKPQRRSQVVQLLLIHLLRFRLARRIEISIVPVQQKQLAVRIGVGPPHLPRLLQQQRAR